MSLFVLILAAGVAATPSATPPSATPGAPFGLGWGQSRAEVEGAGVTLADCTASGATETCLARGLDWSFDDAGEYRLFFDAGKGLATVHFRSEPHAPDRRGHEGRAAYERIATRLSEDYGAPTRREEIFRSPPYQLETQFYACLRHGPKCGVWWAEWRGQGIALQLHASPASKGEGGYVDLRFYSPG